ncbi:MAG: acyl-CoA synthetase [Methanocorpusculum sp.]|nr:acyl-CoA synthetase [Methanocorpusculum sp.]
MKRRPIVAVIGDGFLPPDSEKGRFAEGLGEALVTAGYRVICGGLGGVMEAAARGAHRSPWYRDGDVIGVLPGCTPDAANAFVDIPIATGLDHARNLIVANSDAVVAVGGWWGSLAELSFAWIMRRLILAYRVPHPAGTADTFADWSGVVADKRLDDKGRCPEVPEDRIFGVDTPEEAVVLLAEWLPRYGGRPPCAGRR